MIRHTAELLRRRRVYFSVKKKERKRDGDKAKEDSK